MPHAVDWIMLFPWLLLPSNLLEEDIEGESPSLIDGELDENDSLAPIPGSVGES